MPLTAQTSCFDMSIAPYVSPKCVSVWLLSWKPCLFLLESSLEFVIHRGKNKFISLPVKFQADRSKCQFCTTTTLSNLIIIFTRTVLPCLCFCFLNPAAEIVLRMLFNTLLKITPQNTQKRTKKKRKNKVETFTTIFAVGYPSSS